MLDQDLLKENINARLQAANRSLSTEGVEALVELWDLNPRLARILENAIVEMPLTIQGGVNHINSISL